MHHSLPLITTLVGSLVLAFIFGMIAHRLRISPMVGYLIAGVFCGPFTPGYVADQALAPELAELGVILLMFGVGLHFSVKDLMSVKRIAIPGALAQMALATLMGMGLAALLGWSLVASLVFGLSLSVASTVVLLRALEAQNNLESPEGKIAVGWLVVEDLGIVLVLVLVPLLASVSQEGAGPIVWMALLGDIAMTLGKVAAFVALMLIGGRKAIPWLLAHSAATGSRELFTLAVLAIALGIAFGAAKLFDVSFALGAFFAGIVLNSSELSHKAAHDSLPLRDAFAVLFFVSVGMMFNPAILLEAPLTVLATVAIIVVGKSLAAFTIVRLCGYPKVTALTISASLAQIGELSFILLSLAITLQILPSVARDIVLAGAILSILLNPLLFSWLQHYASRLQAVPDSEPHTAAPSHEEPELPPMSGHVVLVGYGRVGRRVVSQLQERAIPFVVIEHDAQRIAALREANIAAVRGNGVLASVLEAAHLAQASHLLVAIPNGFEAGEVVSQGHNYPQLQILCRAHLDDAEADYLRQQGAHQVIVGEEEVARQMVQRLTLPAAPPAHGSIRIEPTQPTPQI
ncbi:MAG: YbaL family putative K(+) efflux transporter [Aeromonadaceae bacterium]